MEYHDIYAEMNIHKSLFVGGIICFAVVSSTTSNNGMDWYELSSIQITREKYSPQFILLQHLCFNKFLEWSLVEEKKECSGDEISKGRMVSPGECGSACNGVASMFAFGTNDFGVPRCDGNGCQCLCETAAADDGTCDSVQHKGYRLYRFRAVGK